MVYRSFNPYGNPIQGGFNPYGMQQMMRPMPFPPPGPGNFNGPAQAFARGAGNFIGAPGFGGPGPGGPAPAGPIRNFTGGAARAVNSIGNFAGGTARTANTVGNFADGAARMANSLSSFAGGGARAANTAGNIAGAAGAAGAVEAAGAAANVAEGASSLGGFAKLEQYLNTADQLFNTAQKFTPMVKQISPMFQNLPALYRLYKGFQGLPNANSPTTATDPQNNNLAQERRPMRFRFGRNSSQPEPAQPEVQAYTPPRTRPSTPRIFQPPFNG
ncbi:YqfQ family protein [Rummeliibacillus sp. TYF005]|uniref:YqfQ family protein n=1 Tax=Rummeliibacillus sp. TYF005 TaxID=2058214 RepID=UPI001F14F256|nr:YqfQ family protein [Rummeliibacillus sp. TYF005]